MLRRSFLAMIAVLGLAATANAGAVHVFLVVDPATTAGLGIPAAGTFSVASTRSGAGTFHLYAVDAADNSSGIRSYNVKLNGTITGFNHRSPTTGWDDADNNGPFTAGFNDLRSPNNVTPVLAGQGVSNSPVIANLGISAGNFTAAISSAASFSGTVNGQWGNYADPFTSGQTIYGTTRNAIFLGEGAYTGAAPTVDVTTLIGDGGSGVNVWNTQGFPGGGSTTVAAGTAQQLLNTNPFVPEPATITLIGLAVVGFGGLTGRRRS